MTTELLTEPAETKPRRRKPRVLPDDGQKALNLCIETLSPLNKEWREWVLNCLVNWPGPSVQQQLPFGADEKPEDPTELYEEGNQ